jgi:hypothetical protein
MAEAATNAENKAIFLDLAQRWRKLAGEAEGESFTPTGNRITNRRPSHC